MPKLLTDDDFLQLQESLPHVFHAAFTNDRTTLSQAYPLLLKLCMQREMMGELKNVLSIPTPPSQPATLLSQALPKLKAQFNCNALFPYRLPVILSEFPIHSRAINQCIKAFNHYIEAYHEEIGVVLDTQSLGNEYNAILEAIQEHGAYCDNESLTDLLLMLSGWSLIPPEELFQAENNSQELPPSTLPLAPFDDNPVLIKELEQPANTSFQNPFTLDYTYNLNGAGRLAHATQFILANAFGTKIAGHSDAQVKYPPHFIPVELLNALIRRQLSHRIEVWPTQSFDLWIQATLHKSGVIFIAQSEDYSKDIWVNPFLTQPISFLSPEKIQAHLEETLVNFPTDELNPNEAELKLLAHYLFELLQGFQINPGQALGIGANWDGTVNLSNEAGTYAFKFREAEASWGRRFEQLSLHRQGPSEARMNATIGIKYELNALLTNFDYMTHLQPSEYGEVLYNALIDNLVTELLPHPAYFENPDYQKYRKNHIVRRDNEGSLSIDTYLAPSPQGTYFIGKNGEEKQTPKYRRPGAMEVFDFPKKTTCSEQLRVCYEGNPLGPLQLQFAEAMHNNTRGDLVYDPIAHDKFLASNFYGQVMLNDNGDYLPYIGVMPKNFDRHFQQENELCASFVIRMLQSARIREYCPTFIHTLNEIKTRFLPPKEAPFPVLPSFCAEYLFNKQEALVKALKQENRSFIECEDIFYRLFKNIIYSLYNVGREDQQFQYNFLSFINASKNINPCSRASCEKLIRELTVSRPIGISPQSSTRYEQLISYLREITAYFYPPPTDKLAEEIARQARLHVEPLLQSNGITAYFATQRQNPQKNLSRKQSPGMLYAILKHGRPSQTVWDDYWRMHRVNFPSFSRDPDGTPISQPEAVDSFLDKSAKFLGLMTQILHKYNPLALIHNPMSELFMHVRESAAEHRYDTLKPLWMIKDGIEGFFWHGLVKGLWQSAASPFQMASDFFSWQWSCLRPPASTALDSDANPLAIPAAPANEASIKTETSAKSRDLLLQLLQQKGDINLKKIAVQLYAIGLVRHLYPYLTDEELNLYSEYIENHFPLDENEWENLFRPLLVTEDDALAVIIEQVNPYINKGLILAAFRCLTHSSFLTKPEEVIKDTESFFQLTSEQKKGLQAIVAYGRESIDKKKRLIGVFKFKGEIYQALQKRNKQLQKLQTYILDGFNEEAIIQYLSDKGCDITRPHHLLEEGLADENLSIKERAHNKWARFTERELKHKLLSLTEVKSLLILLTVKLKKPKLLALIAQLEEHYESVTISDNDALYTFYETVSALQSKLTQLLHENKFHNDYTDAQSRLTNFLNVTMNAIINARLDEEDIFSDELLPNPLLESKPIIEWLSRLQQNNNDLSSLITQQVQQSPSLDQAIWRCKCLFQVMEKASSQKIPKTGMQSLLRFWIQHRNNVTRTGEPYFSPCDEEMKKATIPTLFAESVTLRQALSRVRAKLPHVMFFSGGRKIEGIELFPSEAPNDEIHVIHNTFN